MIKQRRQLHNCWITGLRHLFHQIEENRHSQLFSKVKGFLNFLLKYEFCGWSPRVYSPWCWSRKFSRCAWITRTGTTVVSTSEKFLCNTRASRFGESYSRQMPSTSSSSTNVDGIFLVSVGVLGVLVLTIVIRDVGTVGTKFCCVSVHGVEIQFYKCVKQFRTGFVKLSTSSCIVLVKFAPSETGL